LARTFVSVLIDTYNHERFIEQAIVSVLEQDFPAAEREIIVVDDGSTDRTPEIVKKFEPLVRLLGKENAGQASAFNAGIPECKGEIIAFLDGDDWWASNKLTRVVQAMAAEPSVGIVGHGIVNVQRDGREQAEVLRRVSISGQYDRRRAPVSPSWRFSGNQPYDDPLRFASTDRACSRRNKNSSRRVLVYACHCAGWGEDST